MAPLLDPFQFQIAMITLLFPRQCPTLKPSQNQRWYAFRFTIQKGGPFHRRNLLRSKRLVQQTKAARHNDCHSPTALECLTCWKWTNKKPTKHWTTTTSWTFFRETKICASCVVPSLGLFRSCRKQIAFHFLHQGKKGKTKTWKTWTSQSCRKFILVSSFQIPHSWKHDLNILSYCHLISSHHISPRKNQLHQQKQRSFTWTSKLVSRIWNTKHESQHFWYSQDSDFSQNAVFRKSGCPTVTGTRFFGSDLWDPKRQRFRSNWMMVRSVDTGRKTTK